MIIAIDFDGTVVYHRYPEIGEDIGAVPVLKKLVECGHKLILFTMRCHPIHPGDRDTLQEAVDWFKDNGIELYGVNENPTQVLWTSSPKPYAHIYIDDSAIGCPLRPDGAVDWSTLDLMFQKLGFYFPVEKVHLRDIAKKFSSYDQDKEGTD